MRVANGLSPRVGVAGITACAVLIGCASASLPPSRATSPQHLPALFDLSAVPARPPLEWAQHERLATRQDQATGRYRFVKRADSVAGGSTTPDTNDARSYYATGVDLIYTDPAIASAAFYWASRIDPSWADPYLARAFTLQVAANSYRRRRIDGQVRTGPIPLPESTSEAIDSLAEEAYLRNPFVDDYLLMDHQATGVIGARMLAKARGKSVPAETWRLAYGKRDWAEAARLLDSSIARTPDAILLYVFRAHAQFYLRQHDSSAATLRSALTRIDRRENTGGAPAHFSKASLAYAIGIADEAAGNDSAARGAYEMAVAEKHGLYMAHLHLASTALATHDTATAGTEAMVASLIEPGDPEVEVFSGVTLLRAGRVSAAVAHLRAATNADPQYALASLYLAQALTQQHDSAGALAAYRHFLTASRRDDSERPIVARVMGVLSGSSPGAR